MSLFVRTEKDGDALILGVLILGNRASAPVCTVLGLEGHLQPFDLTQPPPSMPNQHSPARLPTSRPPRCQPPHTPPGSLPDFQHLHPSHGDAESGLAVLPCPAGRNSPLTTAAGGKEETGPR